MKGNMKERSEKAVPTFSNTVLECVGVFYDQKMPTEITTSRSFNFCAILPLNCWLMKNEEAVRRTSRYDKRVKYQYGRYAKEGHSMGELE
ncbi:hypothetical protein POVCU2_0010610 [Plasmodium ovale curtisi]|uniref:Uncharacterized protein n=1 Tax=Plasmodium ovale curtisi TaxID=864141 RepID=A0A1A8VYU2_PLAOA|nr:hypothetical protein POVCU2_0010610 [Plasmodium ovale curtisi]SBS84029.1 hypothetical protein POVCU1_009820 [Plasmodium ovale curtisi]